jgi:tripartite-type tricarboxylate transporter receptor subunit TctC
MVTRRQVVAALALSSVGTAGRGQAKFPEKSIRIVVPYPAGATADIMIRTISDPLGVLLGQALVVDNRPGAGGLPAESLVVNAAADGYTLLCDGINHVTNEALYDKLPYVPGKDFLPISYVGDTQTVLLAYPGTGFKTTEDLVAAAKRAPGKINFGSAGNGTAGHLSMEMFARATGIQMTHVPFKGASPALNGLLGGQVEVLYTGLPPTVSLVRSSKANALVVSGKVRAAVLPDVPSMGDLGLADQDVVVWFGLLAPPKTPRAIVEQISKAISDVLKQPAVKTAMEQQGVNSVGSTPDQFAALIDKDVKRWPPLLRSLGVKAAA